MYNIMITFNLIITQPNYMYKLFLQESPVSSSFNNPVYDFQRPVPPSSESITLPSHGPHYESSSDPDPMHSERPTISSGATSLKKDIAKKELKMKEPRAFDPTDDDERDVAGLVNLGDL